MAELCNDINTILDYERFSQQLLEIGLDIDESGWIVWYKDTRSGRVSVQIANFIAWPTKEVIINDGLSEKRALTVIGQLANGVDLPEIHLSHDEFYGNLGKNLSQYWGLEVIVKSGQKNRLREAMQILGRNRSVETVYKHTGWKRINERWVFLHAGGAIGAQDIKVDLSEGGDTLKAYELPMECNDQQKAADVTFSLLNVAALEITLPLLGVVFLAPLCELLRSRSITLDFMLFLIGRTQSGKSSLASLFLSFFGNFNNTKFPGNYRDTAYSLERTSFLLKDVLMVVDDYYPAESGKERNTMKEMAQKLARAYGDGGVGSRMGANGRLKQDLIPRGLAISTGEERPDISESGQARFIYIDVIRDLVDYDLYLKLLQEKHRLPEFMVLYIEWIAENWDRIPSIYDDAYQQAKGFFVDGTYPGRINESIAKLCGGLEVGLTFSKERGFIDDITYYGYGETIALAFQKILESNVTSLCTEKPAQKFLFALNELISTGEASLCSTIEEYVPEKLLGCYDDEYVYLLPSKCYQAVKDYYGSIGQRFPIGDKMLWRHLRDEGIIERTESRDRNTVQKRLPCLDGKNVDVLKINRTNIEE